VPSDTQIPTKDASTESRGAGYATLRAEAIRQLERLASGRWTDFNDHDPGITILEQLCYALTDLGYRIDYDIPDLLASSGDPARDLYTPGQVLSSEPVTLTDLRKLALDVPGVKNAWIEPVKPDPPPSATARSWARSPSVATPRPPSRSPSRGSIGSSFSRMRTATGRSWQGT
jgi:hypothetical protein